MKETIVLLVEECAFDYEKSASHRAFKSMDKARKAFYAAIELAESEWSVDEENTAKDIDETSFAMQERGDYTRNHHDIFIKTIEIE